MTLFLLLLFAVLALEAAVEPSPPLAGAQRATAQAEQTIREIQALIDSTYPEEANFVLECIEEEYLPELRARLAYLERKLAELEALQPAVDPAPPLEDARLALSQAEEVVQEILFSIDLTWPEDAMDALWCIREEYLPKLRASLSQLARKLAELEAFYPAAR